MSLASQACLKSLTMPACRAVGAAGALRRADAAAGRGGQLAACRRGAADDLGHFGEGVAEDVVQDERDALGRGHRFEHDEEGHADRLIQGDPVGRVDSGAARPPADPLRGFGQRLGDPFAHVALPPGPGRAEQVEADAAGDRRQPGAGGFDGLLLLPGHGVPAGVGLLDGILGLGQGAQQPVGEIDQLAPLAHDRVQARIGPAVSWPGSGGHGVRRSLGRVCPHQFDETAHRNVRLARRLTFRRAVSSYWLSRTHHPADHRLRPGPQERQGDDDGRPFRLPRQPPGDEVRQAHQLGRRPFCMIRPCRPRRRSW